MRTKFKTLAALAACLLVFLLWGGAPKTVSAATSLAAYDYTVESYNVEMTVKKEREVEVTERYSVAFSGYNSHGIIRDLPLGQGVRYFGLEAECDNADFSPYVRTESGDGEDFLSVYLRGNELVRGEKRAYTLHYTMHLPALEREGELPLNLLGYGMSSSVHAFSARVNLPEIPLGYNVLSKADATADIAGTVITVTAENLRAGQGIELDLTFAPGIIESGARLEQAVLYTLLIGLGLLAAAFLIKLLFCRAPLMTVTVNLEAPENIDPLLMGKLIDGTVDSEDLGAAIFWFADKGYLKIDMEDEEDPVLILKEALPADAPAHLKTVFEGLFRGRERVSVSDLNCAFYRTAQQAKGEVGASAGKLYKGAGEFLIWTFGILALLALGGFAFLYSLLKVYGGYFYWATAVIAAISFAIPAAMSRTAKRREYKWKKGKIVLLNAGGILLGLLPALLGFWFPNAAFGMWVNVIAAAAASLTGAVSGNFLTCSEEHTKRLGQILGFKQFILFTERDKIEFMLKEDPELYYHILPYAQVLGVTDAWTEKFEGLSMKPPAYAYGYRYDVFDVIMFHHIFLTMNTSFARSMVSRPSSGGVGHGGSGGSFGGGGFGGGGMRGC